MNRRERRSTDVSTAVATATERPDQARVAFEALYRASRDDLYAYVAGLLRDHSAAEEVTSQAFERAWRKRRQIDPEKGSPRTWLFGIARNAALDELRRLKRSSELPDDEGPTGDRAPRAAGGDPADVAVRRTALRQAMDELSARERELVAL